MNKLDKIFMNSKNMQINSDSKIVIMSDCHRGASNNFDNFSKNKNILKNYFYQYYDLVTKQEVDLLKDLLVY